MAKKFECPVCLAVIRQRGNEYKATCECDEARKKASSFIVKKLGWTCSVCGEIVTCAFLTPPMYGKPEKAVCMTCHNIIKENVNEEEKERRPLRGVSKNDCSPSLELPQKHRRGN